MLEGYRVIMMASGCLSKQQLGCSLGGLGDSLCLVKVSLHQGLNSVVYDKVGSSVYIQEVSFDR